MSEYAKTPWAVGYGDGISGDVASWGCHLDEVGCHEIVIRSGQEAVAIIYYGDPDSNAEANARHIIHCVNNHERLVEALRNALARMESDLEQIEGEWGMGRSLDTLEREGELTKEILEARTLLADLEAEKGGE